MSKEKINIYVNKKSSTKIDICLSESIQELKCRLELLIPNDLKFMKEGTILNEQQEKDLIIKDIIDKDNSVYLIQEYFYIFIDDKMCNKRANLFKFDTAKTLMKNYQEFLPKNFYIKCEPDIFVEIGNSNNETIKIRNLLIENCIRAYSKITEKRIKCNFDNKKYGYILKEKGNISFVNFNCNNLDIFETLLLDEKYEKYLEQSKYETRKKATIEEYKNINKTKNNNTLKEQLEIVISKDNTNIDALFEYLLKLKENKDPKFKEKLKKYSFMIDINKLKLLDSSFKGDLYKNYSDEKTNLIQFLEKVIENDFYGDLDVDLILSEIDFRGSIQEKIKSPFIGDFDKENYINSPIPISDCNLFFHYLRVKFFQFLQGVFEGKKEFRKFCIELLKKINAMTEEKDNNNKKKLLLEILCMVSIYRFRSPELNMITNLYSHNLDFEYDNLFHPIIFFNRVKNILFDYFRMIANSNCVSTALIEYKKIINYNSEKPADLDIKSSLEYLLRNTIFIPFFSTKEWGLTIPAFNLSFINIDIFCLQDSYRKENQYPDYVFLFYFVKYLISFLHELIGHNFKIYESYNNNLDIPFNSPRIKENNTDNKYSGGYLMEALLINSFDKLNIEHVLFLLNENNWSLEHKIFLAKFKEIKKPNLENCIHLIESGKMLKELFSILKITRDSIENAIKNDVILDTQYSMGFDNETGVMELKLRSNKIGEKEKRKEKPRTKRVCRIKSYY